MRLISEGRVPGLGRAQTLIDETDEGQFVVIRFWTSADLPADGKQSKPDLEIRARGTMIPNINELIRKYQVLMSAEIRMKESPPMTGKERAH